jgi:hypothetical protein
MISARAAAVGLRALQNLGFLQGRCGPVSEPLTTQLACMLAPNAGRAGGSYSSECKEAGRQTRGDQGIQGGNGQKERRIQRCLLACNCAWAGQTFVRAHMCVCVCACGGR